MTWSCCFCDTQTSSAFIKCNGCGHCTLSCLDCFTYDNLCRPPHPFHEFTDLWQPQGLGPGRWRGNDRPVDRCYTICQLFPLASAELCPASRFSSPRTCSESFRLLHAFLPDTKQWWGLNLVVRAEGSGSFTPGTFVLFELLLRHNLGNVSCKVKEIPGSRLALARYTWVVLSFKLRQKSCLSNQIMLVMSKKLSGNVFYRHCDSLHRLCRPCQEGSLYRSVI